jgi:hypothetical protein
MCRKHGNLKEKLLMFFGKKKKNKKQKNGGAGGIFDRILFSFEKTVSPNGEKSPKKRKKKRWFSHSLAQRVGSVASAVQTCQPSPVSLGNTHPHSSFSLSLLSPPSASGSSPMLLMLFCSSVLKPGTTIKKT